MVIYHSEHFNRAYKKLPDEIKTKAEKREQLFRADPFYSLLNTHKLHGKLKDQWSFSVDDRYRVLFEFNGADVVFLDVGAHELYK